MSLSVEKIKEIWDILEQHFPESAEQHFMLGVYSNKECSMDVITSVDDKEVHFYVDLMHQAFIKPKVKIDIDNPETPQ